MQIQRAHRIRLVPNNKQVNYFVRACGVARFTYNWGFDQWETQYTAGENPNANALDKQFNAIKRDEFPFVCEVTKCASQRAFTDLGVAFRTFRRNIKAGRKPGYPKHKKKGQDDSFYITNESLKIKGSRCYIPKLGWVKMREPLRLEGKIMSATVSRTADMWFISIQVQQEIVEPVQLPDAVGIDVGIKELAVTSDGEVFENPRALKKSEKRLRQLHKSVDRKQKGSKNRKKAIVKLARQHYKVSCVRQDASHKATATITKGYGLIGIEDLNVEGMGKNHKIAKALSDASLSDFLRKIEYKAVQTGATVVKASRWYPSSKMCSGCGSVKDKLTLGERVYKCDQCGLILDRDLNAAINLKQYAVGSTVKACCQASAGWVRYPVKLASGQESPVGAI